MGSVKWRHLEGQREVVAAGSGGSLKGSLKWRHLEGRREVAAA
jgi:hypothetical protein